MIPSIQPVRGMAYTDPVQQPQEVQEVSVVYPISATISLSLLSGGMADYFLFVPYQQNSVQRLLLGAETNEAAPSGLTVQLVQVNGAQQNELTSQVSIRQLTILPVELPLPPKVVGAPVFVRVRSSASSKVLFVTAHVLTTEVS